MLSTKMIIRMRIQRTKIAVARFFTKKRYLGNYPRVKRAVLAIVIAMSAATNWYHNMQLMPTYTVTIDVARAEAAQIAPEATETQEVTLDTPQESTIPQTAPAGQLPEGYEVYETRTVSMSAYNSVSGQTDDTPCIAAANFNVCETDEKVVAANGLKLGTKVIIDGEMYTVRDRMNRRYSTGHMDMYFGMDVDAALEFGRQTKEVIILKSINS